MKYLVIRVQKYSLIRAEMKVDICIPFSHWNGSRHLHPLIRIEIPYLHPLIPIEILYLHCLILIRISYLYSLISIKMEVDICMPVRKLSNSKNISTWHIFFFDFLLSFNHRLHATLVTRSATTTATTCHISATTQIPKLLPLTSEHRE